MSVTKLKEGVRRRDGESCRDCGMEQAEHERTFGCVLHIHRQLPGTPYVADGCISLCYICHGRRHGKTNRIPQSRRRERNSARMELRVSRSWLKRVAIAARIEGLAVASYIRSRLKMAMDEDQVPASDESADAAS